MEKTIRIGGQEIRFRASALVPRLYRVRFGRDMIVDMRSLQKSYNRVKALPADASEEERADAQLSALDLTIFENMAFVMAKHATKDLPDSPEEWLDQIDGTFSVYTVLPQLLELWGMGMKTTSAAKKNKKRAHGS